MLHSVQDSGRDENPLTSNELSNIAIIAFFFLGPALFLKLLKEC